MINEEYKKMLGAKSVIRELSEYATKRGTEIGYDNVYDFSLGNPSVPCPDGYTEAVIDIHENLNPMDIHGYSPSTTLPDVRKAVANSLNRRFGMNYDMKHIFMTSGAAGALAHALREVTKPGDKVLSFAPFFPEYRPYVSGCGDELVLVPADTANFQINLEAFEEMLDEKVMAVLINTPNNPSGVVYSEDTIIGSLANYISSEHDDFQPMNANFGLLRPLPTKIRDKKLRYTKLADRAINNLKD